MTAEWLMLFDEDEVIMFIQVSDEAYSVIDDVEVVIDPENNSGSIGDILLSDINDTCLEHIINKRLPFILLSPNTDQIIDVRLLEVRPVQNN